MQLIENRVIVATNPKSPQFENELGVSFFHSRSPRLGRTRIDLSARPSGSASAKACQGSGVSKVVLLPGHVQPVWAGHPWIFAQAVARIEGGATAGDVIDVVDPRGNFLGRGLYSPQSAIVVRICTRRPDVELDAGFFVARIEQAIERRRALGLPSARTNAYRLINAEGDDLPGLVVDVYADVAVVQFASIGMKQRQSLITDALTRLLGCRAIADRTSERTAKLEGFTAERGILRGDPSVNELVFEERGLNYKVPFEMGQKTGFYLDQRSLRGRVEQLANGRRVLDAYCFIGSFSLAAARGGASEVVAIDSSALALETAARMAELNQLTGKVRYEQADALAALGHAGKQGGYDLVVCDPPKLSPNRASRNKAFVNLRRIAAAACRATRPSGLLVLCSCSASLGIDDLTRALAVGGRDVGLVPRVFERWFQGPDHPVPSAFGEGWYLSAVIAGIDTPS
ncbi:MAG TPA: class I SAM-dependent rRNA methyltransferase [Polyangiaceae bacterium]